MSQKILILGGTHGNELTGVNLVNYLKQNPINGIAEIIANPKATAKCVRYIESDLNRSAGKTSPQTYEEKLADAMKHSIQSADLIIEFHNTTALKNSCAIITSKPNKIQIALASMFGLHRMLIMPAKGSLSGYNSNKFFSLEISNSDPLSQNIPRIYACLKQLENLQEFNATNYSKQVEIFKYTGIKVEKDFCTKHDINLNLLQNFELLPLSVVQKLKLNQDSKYYPVFIGEKAYGEDFAFRVVEKIK